ncbi:MAG: HEAT repeat domain-containing protein [Pleurocapsa minor GSE-CHR-MK-17-07R]|jgi:hypothetical protein|nr:HEAT repeat domain-containing protein [Pleurocapsa minor GSE-CHR-MK 17-07R]
MVDAQSNSREQQIFDMMDALESRDASERLAAAQWLGEAAAEPAIEALVIVYQDDPDPKVRAAAAYALGQFKAVDHALKKGQEEKVVALISAVENEGKLGHRARNGGVIKSILSLLLVLIVLLAGWQLLPAGVLAGVLPEIPRPGPPIDYAGRAAAVASFQPTLTNASTNLRTLQNQFTGILAGNTLDCSAFFNIDIAPVSLSDGDARAYPEAAELAARINELVTVEAEARGTFDARCNAGGAMDVPAAASALAPMALALQNLQALNDAYAELSTIPAGVPTLAPTAEPLPATDAPVAGATSEAAPATDAASVAPPSPEIVTPTVAIVIIDPEIATRDLFTIVDAVGRGNPRGPGALILQYWTDASVSGQTQGCNDVSTVSLIPENYALPPETAAAVPELNEAARAVNTALDSIRSAWTTFRSACQVGNLRDLAQGQIGVVTAALTQVEVANTLLQALRNN